jgi:hypothetical protein
LYTTRLNTKINQGAVVILEEWPTFAADLGNGMSRAGERKWRSQPRGVPPDDLAHPVRLMRDKSSPMRNDGSDRACHTAMASPRGGGWGGTGARKDNEDQMGGPTSGGGSSASIRILNVLLRTHAY